MRIRTYDEVDPYEVYKLTAITFGWPLTPRYARHRMRRDPRVLDGYAIYAVERGIPVAQVVPLKMPVRLTSGVEPVGAVAGVCSLPSVWGQGYARRLMDRAHEMYRDLGLRITTLCTSRNIRGYGIYRRMGYRDITAFQTATHRLTARRRRPAGLRFRRARRRDLPLLQSLFETYTRGDLGWSVRDPRYLPMEVAWDPKVLDTYRLVLRDRAAVGYVTARPGWNVLTTEAIVPRVRDFRAAIRALEVDEKTGFARVSVLASKRDKDRYARLGYELYGPTTYVAMAMPLDRGLRLGNLPRTFGAPQGRFVLYDTDGF